MLSKFKETNNTFKNIVSDHGYDIVVFNKDQGENLLPNVGRESHTFLHYIIENYSNLPDEILFSQYDPLNNFRYNSEKVKHFLSYPIFDFIGIGTTDYDLRVIKRKISWLDNYQKIYQDKQLSPHFILPTGCSRYGVFRATKKAILRNTLDFYKRCIDLVKHKANPNEGYFFERAWKYIFTNYGFCMKDHSYIRNSLWLFGVQEDSYKGHVARKDGHFGHIKFYSDGCISSRSRGLYSHPNESFWTMEKNILYILHEDGFLTSSFKMPHITAMPNINTIFGDKYKEDEVLENKLKLNKPLWSEEHTELPK